MGSGRGVLIALVAGAALAEFVLLRVLLRLMGFFPDELGWARAMAQSLGFLGTFALNLAVVGAIILMLVILLDSRRSLILAVPVAWYAWLAAAPLISWPPMTRLVQDPAVLVISSVMASAWIMAMIWPIIMPAARTENRQRGNRRRSVWLLLAGISLMAAHYAALSQAAAALGRPLAGGFGAGLFAEAAALGVALMAPLVLSVLVWRRGEAWLAITAAAVVGGFLLSAPWLARTIAVWTFNMVVYLPGWIYALATAAVIYSIIGLAREARTSRVRTGDGQELMMGAGLMLLLLGGLKPDFTYFALLGLLAIQLLVTPPPLKADPSA